ncbi:MAG TPA: hypothetical protein VK540_26590 [Polyangiaceae bacterium]|nr:hypothetical protein [Polyangiaceae bacterium]
MSKSTDDEVVDYVTGLTAAQANDPDALRAMFCETSKQLVEERRTTARLREENARQAATMTKAVEMLCADEPNMKMQTADLLRAEIGRTRP